LLYISRCRKMCEVASFKDFENSLTTVKVMTKTKVAPFYLGHGVQCYNSTIVFIYTMHRSWPITAAELVQCTCRLYGTCEKRLLHLHSASVSSNITEKIFPASYSKYKSTKLHNDICLRYSTMDNMHILPFIPKTNAKGRTDCIRKKIITNLNTKRSVI